MLPITLRRLEVFVAVVESRSFGAAASALGISQPSVSVHMRTLEKKVGAPLFDRHPGVAPQLTDAGRTLYIYAQDTLERATAMSVQLGHGRRKLRFAAQRFVANSLLAKTFATLTTAFPDVEVIARTGTFEEVHTLFQNGAVDLVFMLSAGHDLPDWHTGTMGRYRLAFVASPEHPLSQQQRIPGMRRAGLPKPPTAAQAEEAGTVRDMVIADMGIACTLRRSVQSELAAGTIVELDVDIEPMYLVLSYARNPKAVMPEIDSLITMVLQSEHLLLPVSPALV